MNHALMTKPLINLVLVAVIFAVALMSPRAILGQSPDADVDFYVVEQTEVQTYTVGDFITLRLEVIHPADSRVELPELEDQWGDFEVVDQTGQDTVRNEDGTSTTRKDIVVSLFEPGQYQTPRLVLKHHKADQSTEELSSPVIPLKIDSVLVEGDEQLRALKEQVYISVPPLWPWVLGGMILATAAAGGLFWAGRWAYDRWWPRPPVASEPVVAIDTRPPELIAYEELARIEALDLPAMEEFKEHFSLVTDCLRQYIENRYDISALEQTTAELQYAFQASAAVSSEHVRGFINVFRRSDLVKFARLRPARDEAYGILDEARSLVEITTPAVEPPLLPTSTDPQEPAITPEEAP
jgi:hypothetical protein